MPPKSKFTKEEVVAAAVDIAERDGIDALTARTLASLLGSSARPIFTVYNSMDEVIGEVMIAVRKLYTEYVEAGLRETPAFKGVGTAYIKFAVEHPKLFMLLFMRERDRVPDVSSLLGVLDDSAGKILDSIMVGYGFDSETAQKIYLHLFTYSHGIATLIATKVCAFTAEQISTMLTEVFKGILIQAKKGELTL